MYISHELGKLGEDIIANYITKKGYTILERNFECNQGEIDIIAKDKEEMYELEEQYYFKYLDTIKNERPAEIRKGVYNPRRRKVKCLNDGKIFATVTDCAKYYGKGRTTISNVLINEKEHTWINGQKYRFEYIN